MQSFRSELRKLLTVRTTLYLTLAGIAITIFFAGYVTGYKMLPPQLADPHYLQNQALQAISFVTIFASFVGVLLVGHEYRYTTITYSMTLARRRSHILASKITVITIYMLLFAVLIAILSPVATVIGAHLHGYELVAQSIDYGRVAWTALFYAWAYAMYAMIATVIIRNQIGAIIFLLVFPSVVESILNLLLKANAQYLPFAALANVTNVDPNPTVAATKAAATALVYVVVGWIVAWTLFLKRDAN